MASSVQEGLDAEQEYQEGSFNSSLSADQQDDDSNNNLKQPGDPQKEERLSRSQQAIYQDVYQTQQGQLIQQPRGATQRAGSLSGKGDMYQMKNQETIQRLAEKKRQQQEEKEKEAKRQKRREEKLRARMLAEAAKFRETKEKENPPTMSSKNISSSNNDVAMSKNNTRKSLSAANENAKGNLNESNQSSHSNIHENNHSVNGIEGIEGLRELSSQQQQGQQLQQQYQNNQNLKQQVRRLKFKDVEQMYELVVVKGKYSRQQLTEQQAQELSELEARINEERESLQKMQKVFRTRQITFLEELKRKQEQKKQEEEQIKLKLEKKASKLKEQYENVSSNIFAETEMSKLKRIEKEEDPNKNVVRATSAEEMQYKEEKKETLKKIQQKNQEYIEKLKEKKLAEKLKEEEEKKKKDAMRERIKDFVLVNIKKEIENGTFFVDVPEKKPKKEHQKRKTDEIQSNPLASPKATLTPLSVTRKVEKLPKIKDPMKDNADDGQNDDENEDGDDSGGSDGEGGTTESGVVKKKLRKYPFIVDLDIWKKKQRLPADTKVFIVTGGYHDIKKSLLKRGWVDNPDSRSPCFNLRWSLQTKDIDYESLKDFQIANHFQKSACITTKVGLTKSIRNLVWHDNVDIDAFFPRCYDLNDQEDFDNFMEEFKTSKAESILKRYMRMFQEKDPDIEKLKKQAVIALNVCERRIRDLDDIIDDPNCVHLVTKKEWNILSSDELSEEKLAQKKYDSWLERIEGKKKTIKKKKKKKVKAQNETEEGDKVTKKEGEEEDEEDDDDEQEEEPEVMDEFTTKVHAVLKKFAEKFSQDTLTGEDNIWIIKPAGLSRGRGITCYNNLVEILDHVKSKESQWVIQKYIENPLIIKKRKFDVRVWVLVTDWNPVTIWHFVDCYVRFSVDDYDTENLQNKFTHLTNNMISKLKQREEKDDISELGNMYFKENFIEFLKAKEGYDVFTDKIEPQMRHAIIMSLKSVQDTIENRKGSHEMYGYDFMIDDLYNTWLIEINSSPSMEYSTPVTERLVKAVSEDIVKVVVDYGMEKSKKARKDIDTGAFKRIYKGKYVEENSGTVGLALVCEGVAMKKKKNNTAKVTTLKPNFPPAS